MGDANMVDACESPKANILSCSTDSMQ
jgi:hypothetical protein